MRFESFCSHFALFWSFWLLANSRARIDLPKKIPLGTQIKINETELNPQLSSAASFVKSFVKTTKTFCCRGCRGWICLVGRWSWSEFNDFRPLEVERIPKAAWSMCTQINCLVNGGEDWQIPKKWRCRSNLDGRFGSSIKGTQAKCQMELFRFEHFRFSEFVFDRTQARFARISRVTFQINEFLNGDFEFFVVTSNANRQCHFLVVW